MSSPAADPISLQVLTLLAGALAQISVANGFYTDVAAAGVEPINFDVPNTWPRIFVHEESGNIADSNAQLAMFDTVVAVQALMPVKAANAVANAHRLRDDMVRACGRIAQNKRVFEVDGTQLVKSFQLLGPVEVTVAPDAQDFVQAVVHVSISHNRIFTT